MAKLKYIFHFQIPYWKGKEVWIALYVQYSDAHTFKRLTFSTMYVHKMVDTPGYEDDWSIGKCKYYKISEWESK